MEKEKISACLPLRDTIQFSDQRWQIILDGSPEDIQVDIKICSNRIVSSLRILYVCPIQYLFAKMSAQIFRCSKVCLPSNQI